jgi:hypothetical protein
MSKSNKYLKSIDPEERRWGRKYPRFPGVAEYARLIRARKAKGTWADIISHELAENATACLDEMIEVYRTGASDDVRLYLMMALDIARVPASVPFLAEVLHQGNSMFTSYAKRALAGIDTTESRAVLWKAKQKET